MTTSAPDATTPPGVDPAHIGRHLFVVPQNNSGSTFLTACLHACRRVIGLPCEGQHAPGFHGPVPRAFGDQLVWGRDGCRTAAVLATDVFYDWEAIRRAWYAAAVPRTPGADLFVEKSPPNVARVALLDRHFPDSRFLFLVRDPWAVAESVIRHRADLPSVVRHAGTHVVATLARQRANVDRYGPTGQGQLVRYEDLCGRPLETEAALRRWRPELDDLCVRRRVAVKGRYDQWLTDLNGAHHARLTPDRRAALAAVFAPHSDLFTTFGYSTDPPVVAHPRRRSDRAS